jgi:membrane-associated phospholipid phosphatase
MGRRTAALALGFLTLAGPAGAQCVPSISAAAYRATAPRRPLVRWSELVGFAAVTTITFANDQGIRNFMHDRSSRFGNAVGDVGNGFGNGFIVYPALIVGTAGGELFHAPGLYHVSWRALQSTALAGLGTVALKSLLGRRRPNVNPDDPYDFHLFSAKDNSFPSGHTAVAFGLATSLAMETKDHWSDAALYGMATVTAFARMHYDKHWASDTVVGAGLGILSARLVRRHDRSLVVGPGALAASFAF